MRLGGRVGAGDTKYKGSCTYQRRGILERQPPFSGNSLLFFLSSLRFPSQFLVYYNFNVGLALFSLRYSFCSSKINTIFYNGADRWTQSAGVFVSQNGFRLIQEHAAALNDR